MASTHHQQAPAYGVPHSRNDQQQRLPSLRAMDFFHGHAPPSVAPSEYPPPSSSHHSRQEPPPAWSRSATSPSVHTSQQHATHAQARHAEISKPQSHYTPSHSGVYASPQQPPPPPAQTRQATSSGAHGNTRGDVMQQQPAPKRSQSNSSVSETPGRSPQTAYPPHAHPHAQYAVQQSYHQTTAPAPPAETAHHPQQFSQPPVAYQYPPQQPMSQGQRYHAPPPPPARAAHQAPAVHQSPSAHPSTHQLPPPHNSLHRPPSNHQQHSPAHQAHQAPPPQNHPPANHPPPPPPAAHQPLAVHHSQQPHHSQPPPHHTPTSHQSGHHSSHQPPPPVQSGHPPSGAYPPQVEHWSHPPPPAPSQSQAPAPPQSHQAYENYNRSQPPIPLPIDPRTILPSIDPEKLASRRDTISKIVEHCNELYQFANRYANPSNTPPTPSELQEMTHLANTVVNLLEDLRRLDRPSDQPQKEQNGVSDEQRPPKRPWEDMARDDEAGPSGVPYKTESPDEKTQSTAEADMELIRSKRATSSAVNVPGQPKSKYRKRSRATPPGKCHSCNIRETPEWRRGPDGARTLCNACGLHYAKLMRKRDKAGLGPDGKPITIESLRASTASARGAEHGEPLSQAPPSHHHMPPPPHPAQGAPPQSPYTEHASMKQVPAPMHPSHHTSQHPSHPPTQPSPAQYHSMPMPPGPPPPGQHPHHHMMGPPPPPPPSHTNHSESGHNVPPPWMTSPQTPARGYGDHQSYMRTSHAASHARASPH